MGVFGFATEGEGLLVGGEGVGVGEVAALFVALVEEELDSLSAGVFRGGSFLFLAGGEEQAECEERAGKHGGHVY